MDVVAASSPFEKVRCLIGSYAAIGSLFDPPVSPQGVAKWEIGVPSERVLRIAQATKFAVTPHQLRPDIYPHPDDALPEEMRGGGNAVRSIEDLKERAA